MKRAAFAWFDPRSTIGRFLLRAGRGRGLGLAQALLSFAYNTAIVALTINLLADLLR